jgi:hypothetical protein
LAFPRSVTAFIDVRLKPSMPLGLRVLLAAEPPRLRLIRIAASMWVHGLAPYTSSRELSTPTPAITARGASVPTVLTRRLGSWRPYKHATPGVVTEEDELVRQ